MVGNALLVSISRVGCRKAEAKLLIRLEDQGLNLHLLVMPTGVFTSLSLWITNWKAKSLRLNLRSRVGPADSSSLTALTLKLEKPAGELKPPHFGDWHKFKVFPFASVDALVLLVRLVCVEQSQFRQRFVQSWGHPLLSKPSSMGYDRHKRYTESRITTTQTSASLRQAPGAISLLTATLR